MNDSESSTPQATEKATPRKSLWAPWRIQYVTDTQPREPGCFFCNAYRAKSDEALKNHLVLGRGELAFVMLNRFPYSSAHLMVAPARHIGTMEEVTPEESAVLWSLSVICKDVLADRVNMDGCNIGINQGKVAGAGVLDHIHIHIVPRWNGDTNFMPVLADVRVMPQALEDTWEHLRPAFAERGL